MTRPSDKHLDSDDLDALVSLLKGGEPGAEWVSEAALAEALSHARSCPDCGRKVQMHKSVQDEMSQHRTATQPAGPDCLGEAEWLDVAAGLLPEERAKALMNHAAQCGHCAPLLKGAAEVLAGDATPGEEALLESASSAQPAWQKRMSATLRSVTLDSRRAKAPARSAGVFS